MKSRPSHFRIVAIVLCLLNAGSLPAFAASRPRAALRTAVKHHSSSHRNNPTLADSLKDDIADYDDPAVRKAAIESMGHFNGSVVAIDPSSGRILSVVNQKLAFGSGFIPCSTIKPVIAVAALQEGVVTRDTMIRVAPRKYLNLTEALAHSNNAAWDLTPFRTTAAFWGWVN